MNTVQFNAMLKLTYDRLFEISNTKGKEYAGSEDRLANFKRLGADLDLLPEQVLLVYFTKHLDSIRTYIKDKAIGNARVLSEPIEGRIDDAILYLVLLKGLIFDAEMEKLPRVAICDPSDDFDESPSLVGERLSISREQRT